MSFSRGHNDRDERERRVDYNSPEYWAILRAFSRTVSPHLVTLALQVGTRQPRVRPPVLPFLDTPFPRLRELTLLGVCEATGFVVSGYACTLPLFPTLTHLHICAFESSICNSLEFWRTHAPGATHIRLPSALWAYPEAIILTPAAGDESTAAHTREAYPRAGFVIVRDDPLPSYLEGRYPALREKLEELRCACAERGVSVVQAEPCDLHYEDWVSRMYSEWSDRLKGGAGCWGELRRP